MKKIVLYRGNGRLENLLHYLQTYTRTHIQQVYIRDLDMQFMRSETGKIDKMLCIKEGEMAIEEEEKDARTGRVSR